MPKGVFCMRVENGVMPGTPDIYLSRRGRGTWIESKVIKTKKTLRVNLRDAQKFWHRVFRVDGGAVWIVAMRQNGTRRPEYYLVFPHELDEQGRFDAQWYEDTGRGTSLEAHLENIVASLVQ